jgi:hypothetical protein
VSYIWVSGGVEQNTGTDTSYKSSVDYVYTKGVANGVEPTMPTGNIKLAIISNIDGADTSITTAMISDRREFLTGPGFGITPPALPSGSLKSFIEAYGFLRNGFFPVIDMLATKTLAIRRTANATDIQPLQTWSRPGSTDPVTTIDRRGHLHENYKRFREDWLDLDIGGTSDFRWQLTVTGTATATRGSSKNGAVVLATGTGGSDIGVLTTQLDFEYTGATGFGGSHASENLFSQKWAVDISGALTSVQIDFGMGSTTDLQVGFAYSSAGLGAVPAANWALTTRITGPAYVYANSGVAAVASTYVMFEIVQRSATVFDFYIAGALVGTATQTLLVTSGPARASVRNLTTATRQITCKLMQTDMGRLFTD